MSESPYARARRDQQIANEQPANQSLMCAAHGCPNRWAVDTGRRCCTAHAWADMHDWPAITQRQQDAETDRAIEAQRAAYREPAAVPSREERVEILQRMRASFGQMARPGRSWALKLRAREQAGEILSMAQREAWRAALKGHDLLDAVRDGSSAAPREAIDAALTATGDLPSLGDGDRLDEDDALWAQQAREAEREEQRESFADDPRFAAWVAGAPV